MVDLKAFLPGSTQTKQEGGSSADHPLGQPSDQHNPPHSSLGSGERTREHSGLGGTGSSIPYDQTSQRGTTGMNTGMTSGSGLAGTSGPGLTGERGFEDRTLGSERSGLTGTGTTTGLGSQHSGLTGTGSQHNTGRDAALGTGAGVAGLGAYEERKHHHQDNTTGGLGSERSGSTGTGTGARVNPNELTGARADVLHHSHHGGDQLGSVKHEHGDPRAMDSRIGHETKHEHHTGRDAALGAGAGAAGVGAYEERKHHHDRDNTTGSSAIGGGQQLPEMYGGSSKTVAEPDYTGRHGQFGEMGEKSASLKDRLVGAVTGHKPAAKDTQRSDAVDDKHHDKHHDKHDKHDKRTAEEGALAGAGAGTLAGREHHSGSGLDEARERDAGYETGSTHGRGLGSSNTTDRGLGSSTGTGVGSSTGNGLGSSTGTGLGSSTGTGLGSSTGTGLGSSSLTGSTPSNGTFEPSAVGQNKEGLIHGHHTTMTGEVLDPHLGPGSSVGEKRL
ncbi:hypothetical protein LTR62_006225 [Meristemomyces frigidus]|uniref:Uncharacterized protein n=1 Tax=Meristemomyces frigidus TaxID=1508187 RepID=A0AAN7YN33_9PEZI|nr:hypothetical protein LTR62_006225 [Meristemomyces frigidus]